jgi:hypothetical protein
MKIICLISGGPLPGLSGGAAKALEQEPIKLEFLEEAVVTKYLISIRNRGRI